MASGGRFVNDVKLSKFMSLVLRHQPGQIDLTLDDQGWVEVDELVGRMVASGRSVQREDIERVVRENDKKRFTIDPSGTRIRASQGHSIKVDLGLAERLPPDVLYHGTVSKVVPTIERQGLRKMRRHHVHLSADMETARRVGSRRGRPVIFAVDAKRMVEASFRFYCSENGVWLVDNVPADCLKIVAPREERT